jgi:hypothetical protein
LSACARAGNFYFTSKYEVTFHPIQDPITPILSGWGEPYRYLMLWLTKPGRL